MIIVHIELMGRMYAFRAVDTTQYAMSLSGGVSDQQKSGGDLG